MQSPKNFLLLACLGLLWFYGPALFGGQQFYYRDNTLFFEPLCMYIGERFSRLELPLWNPFCYCGMSQVAIPSPGIFYPPNWLFAFKDYSRCLALILVFHQLLLGAGTYLLGRSFGLGIFASTIAGLSMALSSWCFSLESNYTIVAGAAWIPASIYLMRSLAQSISAVRFILLSLSITLMIFAGRPEIFVPGLFLVALFPISEFARLCLLRAKAGVENNKDSRKKHLLFQLSALVCGVALAAPQIAPALEWLSLSRRADGLATQEVLLMSASWTDLLGIIFPQPLGDLCLRGNQYLTLNGGRMAPFIPSVFIGPVAVTLCLLAPRGKFTLCAWLAFALTATWCLGSNTPAAGVALEYFPALSIFRFPSKFLLFPLAALAALAAAGAERLTSRDFELRLPILVWMTGIILGIVVTVFPMCGPYTTLSVEPRLAIAAGELLGKQVVLWSCAGLVFSFILFAFKRTWISLTLTQLIATAALTLSISASAVQGLQHFAPPDYYTEQSPLLHQIQEIESTLKKDEPRTPVRVLGLALESFTCPPERQTGSPHEKTWKWYQYANLMLNPNTNMTRQVPSSFGYESSMNGKYYDALVKAYDASSQSRIEGGIRSDAPIHDFCLQTATGYVTTQIYRFARADGRPETVPILSPEFFHLIQENQRENLRLYKVVNSKNRLEFESAGNEKSIRVLSETPERLLLEISSDAPGRLIVRDQLWPGWQVRVDNLGRTIEAHEKFFRTVNIPPGKHIVEFFYDPHSLKLGMIIMALGVLFAFTILALMRNPAK